MTDGQRCRETLEVVVVIADREYIHDITVLVSARDMQENWAITQDGVEKKNGVSDPLKKKCITRDKRRRRFSGFQRVFWGSSPGGAWWSDKKDVVEMMDNSDMAKGTTCPEVLQVLFAAMEAIRSTHSTVNSARSVLPSTTRVALATAMDSIDTARSALEDAASALWTAFAIADFSSAHLNPISTATEGYTTDSAVTSEMARTRLFSGIYPQEEVFANYGEVGLGSINGLAMEDVANTVDSVSADDSDSDDMPELVEELYID
ncbi:hypothetical protein DFH11DRAFT_1550771 [Phellopilus nigrolimitatus]|nr:hypothetical protein DFH11DRAFT_1550771 [Phellopilus nigrolimitatus]